MELYAIETGNLMMDGGAAFGVVPKSLWSRFYPSDDKNMCNFAMRTLLIVDGDRKILIDTGMGNKQPESFTKFYYPNGNASLMNSLKLRGFNPEEITDVILTHLHFDHCGGAVIRDEGSGELVQAFPNAKYYVAKAQYEYALNPSVRDGASYFPDNFVPLMEAGVLNLVEDEGELLPNIEVRFFYGHTEAQMIPIINYFGYKIYYAGDLLPTAAHFSAAWVMAYDNKPLVTIQENEAILKEVSEVNGVVFFEHDFYTECATVKNTPKGYRTDGIYSLDQWLNKIRTSCC